MYIEKNIYKPLSRLFLIFIDLLVILIIILFLLVAVNRFFQISLYGYSIFYVASGSMSPTLNVGDYILVKEKSEYNVGDIITYESDRKYVTHRVYQISSNEIVTKGDFNNSVDEPIKFSQVKGKYIKTLVVFGKIYFLISNKSSVVIFIFLILIINVLSLIKIKKEVIGSD